MYALAHFAGIIMSVRNNSKGGSGGVEGVTDIIEYPLV